MRRLLPTLLLSAPLTLAANAASTVAENAPGLTISAVGVSADSGGYPSISWGFYGLSARFTDSTPDGSHRYVATATEQGGDGAAVEADAYVYEEWDGTSPSDVTLPKGEVMQIGDTFEVVVREYAGDRLVEESAPVAFTIAPVSHPSKLSARTSGKHSVVVGEVVKLRSAGGYGDDVASVTQVIAARKGETFSEDPRDFLVCLNSYCPTAKGVKAVTTKSRKLTTRFRVPASFAGKTLVFAVYGQSEVVDGVRVAVPWGWYDELKVRRS